MSLHLRNRKNIKFLMTKLKETLSKLHLKMFCYFLPFFRSSKKLWRNKSIKFIMKNKKRTSHRDSGNHLKKHKMKVWARIKVDLNYKTIFTFLSFNIHIQTNDQLITDLVCEIHYFSTISSCIKRTSPNSSSYQILWLLIYVIIISKLYW